MQRRAFTTGLLALPAIIGTARAASGWTPLFNGRNLNGFTALGDANWRVERGVLVADRGNGFLVSRADYTDFHLRTEVFLDSSANSGIFIRCTDPATINATKGYEVNLWDERPDPSYGTGAIVDVAAVNPMPKAGGRWNEMDIIASGDSFTVILNNEMTVNGAKNARNAKGRIALQHGVGVPGPGGAVNDRGAVRFRKVEIRTL